MHERACPAPEQLQAYAAGRLPEPSFQAVDDHVETCSTCQDLMATLDDAGDTLLSRIRRPSAEVEYQGEPEYQAAIAHAKGLAHAATTPPAQPSVDLPGEAFEPKRLGEYELTAQLGAGGMGVVYQARHLRLDREVAVKVLSADRVADPKAVDRFDREIRAVGKLNHPHIVQAHDAGDIDGTHFLAMEYVAGQDLAAVVKRVGPLRVADACEVVRQAAVGLQYAHQHGMVHRDIKPSNLMLALSDQPSAVTDPHAEFDTPHSALVKILDLGLALLQDRDEENAPDLTTEGQMMGTLDYMAPEQGDDSHDVDIRADVYSLGATLYKLLTNQTPFSGKPVAKLMALASETPVSVHERRPDVPEALSAMIDRMLAKRPEDRLATPAEVARALTPFCEGCALVDLLPERDAAGEPAVAVGTSGGTNSYRSSGMAETNSAMAPADVSLARRPSESARATQPVDRRTRFQSLMIVAAAAASVLLLAGVVVLIKNRFGETVGRMELADDLDAQVIRDPAEVPTTGAPTVGESSADSNMPDSFAALSSLVPPPLTIEKGDPVAPGALVAYPPPVEGLLSWTVETVEHRGAVYVARYSPDGERIASAGDDSAIRIWEASTGRLAQVLLGHQGSVLSVSWSPDGQYLASGGYDRLLRIWHVSTGRMVLVQSGHAYDIGVVAWSPDGETIASSDGWSDFDNGKVYLWEIASGQLRQKGQADAGRGRVRSLAWSPDSHRLAAGPRGPDRVRVWDVVTDEWMASPIEVSQGVRVAWSPCGEYLLEAGYRKTNVWKFRTQEVLHSSTCMFSRRDAGWFPDGSRFFLPHPFGKVDVACVDEAIPMTSITLADLRDVVSLDISPAGDMFVVGCENGHLGLFSANTGQPVFVLSNSQPGMTSPLSWSPDGQKLASGTRDYWVQAWDVASGELLGKVARHMATATYRGEGVKHIAWHPDGHTLAIASRNPNVLIAELGSGGTVPTKIFTKMSNYFPEQVVAWSPEGDRLAWLCGGVGVSQRSGEPLFANKNRGVMDRLAWSPNGELIAQFGGTVGFVEILHAQSGDVLRTIIASPKEGRVVRSLAWSPNSSRIAVGCSGNAGSQIHVWQMDSGKKLKNLVGHQDSVDALHWLDDTRLMSLAEDETLKIWDTTTGRLLKTSPAPTGEGIFSPDGGRVAHSLNNAIRVWNTDTGRIDRTFMLVCDDQYVSVTGDGRIDHSPDLRTELTYVLLTADGQRLSTTRPVPADGEEETSGVSQTLESGKLPKSEPPNVPQDSVGTGNPP